MPRLRLDIPDFPLFTTELEVRVTDLNYGKHLGNQALLGLLHEARLRWLRERGFADELDVGGCGLIMADVAISFSQEAFLGERLRVELRRGECTRSGFDLYYLVTKVHDRQSVAQAKTFLACFDYQTRRVCAIPAELQQALQTEDSKI
ncbi:acyl-CoA thioesterase [Chitinilyticum litopenaei]|uniref:acyl-CoA thioesterase n=1 Tax=Chitinilyticum litopenaei TaxID=1121276 RepID=UPI000427D49A|nr:thioesterase family protein [Chitinilyticum litopenaei]